MLANEAKHDDKLVKQALKDLKHTEKEEHRAQKVSMPPLLPFERPLTLNRPTTSP